MHPDNAQLPDETDFLDPQSEDLDERHALKMFLGKTAGQAEELFQKGFTFYQEDLIYMRATAFRFYVQPAIRYLLSQAARSDSDAVSAFCYVLESRLENDPDALKPIAPIVGDAIRQILGGFARYDCSADDYGDVAGRYQELARRLDA